MDAHVHSRAAAVSQGFQNKDTPIVGLTNNLALSPWSVD
jgi:hypothetical protein